VALLRARPRAGRSCHTFEIVKMGTAKFQLLASKKIGSIRKKLVTVSGQGEFTGGAQSLARAALEDLFQKSRAAEYGIGCDEFAAILAEVAGRWAGKLGIREFSSSLRLEDLALARGCAAGNERAWEVFMLRFREKLYDVARQITRQDGSARELADCVYADLFGTKSREGARISKLSSYSGRGSLDGWLRTVLAQEFVNTYRKQRRLVSLDEESEEGGQFPAPAVKASAPADPLLERATEETLGALADEERFLLASYFLDGRTLAQIARVLAVHESTISRRVEKLTKSIRKQIVKRLVGYGMNRCQAEEALSADVRDLSLDIRTSLAQAPVAGAFSEKEGGV
jgi:RNA polymerase sigma-70 factor, ECF subfamily